MKHGIVSGMAVLSIVAACVISLVSEGAMGAGKPSSLTVAVKGISRGTPIPETQALCTPTADGKSEKVKAPLRPTIRWSGAPKQAKSFAVFVMDPDVPADFTDASKDGKVLAAGMKRMDFFHYGIVNLPIETTELKGGDATKAPDSGLELVNDLGLNDYVNPKESYGGPCPPWNDARQHHYHFIVLALDKDAPVTVWARNKTALEDDPNTAKATFNRLMESKHVLAKGVVVGTYTLNKDLRAEAAAAK